MEVLQFLLPSLLTGLVCSFVIEQFLTPKPSLPWLRLLPALLLHIGTWTVVFAIVLLLFRRPWFAVITLCAFQLLLVLVNHAKYSSLREAFIFQDFEYFTDAIRHPRLYLPFFGIGRTVAAALGFIGAIVTGMVLEAPLTETLPGQSLAAVWAIIFAGSLLLIRQGLKHCPAISCDPAKDLYHLGQIAFFWAYRQAEKHTEINLDATVFNNPLPAIDPAKLPNIVAVQSESFFDPRALSDTIKPSVLENFDQIKTEARCYGRLHVPAWGANTVRTECGFLSGLAPEQLGVHRFNPYRVLAQQSIPNLARYLKHRGYRTLCIHPYPAGFYLRDRVFPRMGFDHFIDIGHFNALQKSGQFIGDLTVADKVDELLRSQTGEADGQGDEKPLFIFVITMENHGPLHLEQPEPSDQETFYHQPPPAGWDDLTVYLRHLKNADLMIKRLKESLHSEAKASEREGVLCWYGDHVPIMATVYQLLGEPDGLTDYFIWATAPQTQAFLSKPHTININELAILIPGVQ